MSLWVLLESVQKPLSWRVRISPCLPHWAQELIPLHGTINQECNITLALPCSLINQDYNITLALPYSLNNQECNIMLALPCSLTLWEGHLICISSGIVIYCNITWGARGWRRMVGGWSRRLVHGWWLGLHGRHHLWWSWGGERGGDREYIAAVGYLTQDSYTIAIARQQILYSGKFSRFLFSHSPACRKKKKENLHHVKTSTKEL